MSDTIVEIKDITAEPISINPAPVGETKKPVNFGGGIELLVNDKRKTPKSPAASKHSELSNLESELNQLSGISKPSSGSDKKITLKSLPALGKEEDNSSTDIPTVSIGASTAKDATVQRPPELPMKFNNIPISPDKPPSTPVLSKEQITKEKYALIRKLENLEKKGAKLSRAPTMETSLTEMRSEYEILVSDKERSNSVKFQGKMLMAAITGIEFLNSRFDPFDVNLDGWGEQINENISDYDEIFSELHEKYKSKAKIAPELKLIFQLAGSAVMVHMTNTMFKSSMPGMDDIMKQNPELMQQFTKAAVNTMGEQSPGFGDFVGSVMGNRTSDHPPPPNMDVGPPPPPMRTRAPSKSSNAFQSRPDLREARGVNMIDPLARVDSNQVKPRPEMKGPSNIDEVLAGLKSKPIPAVQPSKTPRPLAMSPQDTDGNINDASTVSIQDLKNIATAKMPASTGKKNSTPKTSISLNF